DYEMMWNFLPDTPEKQKIYRDWFLECTAAARLAAKELNQEKDLRILPIVSGSTEDEKIIKFLNSKNENHVPAQWLLDVVSVSDYLGMDTYDFDINNPTISDKTIETFSFWIKNYSQGKPAHITEFGYSSVNSYYPEYKPVYHASGTEEQQRDFYASLLPAIVSENKKGKLLNGQVRSCCFWMYSDMKTSKTEYKRENHFGLIRLDGSKKPAFDVMKSNINRIENNPATATSLANKTTVITAKDLEKGVEIQHISGTEFDLIEYVFENNSKSDRNLCIQTEKGGSVLVEVDGQWYFSDSEKGNLHILKIKSDNSLTTAKIYFPGGKFPSSQIVKKIFIQ
ncbi:MAG: hypothetical protein NT144_04080, partial [Bacteroidia bacterium]|nr:hypothetical protein [Bacteroidia bacterium]